MKVFWTEHAKLKMRQYGLSKIKLLNLLHKPERVEQGIALGTMAAMQTNKKYQDTRNRIQKRLPGEVWIMYADVKDFRKIVSAWRYPGVSKPGDQIPIPEDIRRELLNQ